jgi:hypothetical protein
MGSSYRRRNFRRQRLRAAEAKGELNAGRSGVRSRTIDCHDVAEESSRLAGEGEELADACNR